jgi:ABC-2 type transport system ATP-binding protein
VPDRGRIRIAGLDPRRDRKEVRQLLGVQLQESQLPDKLTVAEAMRLYASFYRHPADIAGLLEMLDLTEKRNTRYRRLSGGQKQRLSVALALIGRPRIAILDELTTGLDPVARRDAWQLIDDLRSSGVTIMLITHFMPEAERLCDRVAIMRDGQIVALGTPAALGRPTLEDAFIALTDRALTDRRQR